MSPTMQAAEKLNPPGSSGKSTVHSLSLSRGNLEMGVLPAPSTLSPVCSCRAVGVCVFLDVFKNCLFVCCWPVGLVKASPVGSQI